MRHASSTCSWARRAAVAAALFCTDCGPPRELPAVPAGLGTLSVELMDAPTVAFDAARGATTLAATVTVRAHDGTPLGPRDVDVALLLDGAPLDSESILQESSAARAVNLTYTLVLDATYSMLEHGAPAFEPMKQAARQSVQAAAEIWDARPGKLVWTVNWFDDYIYRPDDAWPDSALLAIPTPTQGLFTRMYAAVDHAIDDLPRLQAGQFSAAPHHVLVVFSDGKDNHSWSDTGATDEAVTEPGGMRYRRLGWRAVALDEIVAKLAARPDITLHTIGMGRSVSDPELEALAAAGHGIYVRNPAPEHIGALFERVTREFTTLQTVGATIPNPPGDYALTVRVSSRSGVGSGELELRLHAGDAGAQLIR